MLIDSHAHLDLFAGDRNEVIARAFAQGLSAIVTVGIDLNSSKKTLDIARSHKDIYAVLGVHPHDAKMVTKNTIDEIGRLAAGPTVVAIGETGLDYYRRLSPEDVQVRVFHQFLDLAADLKLPIVIHDRDAHDQVLRILAEQHEKGGFPAPAGPGVIHCISGDWAYAKTCLDMGFYISVPGVVTFPKAQTLHEVVKKLPADRILVETDCPFLTPEPFRGKRNEPAYVKYTAQACARLRGEDAQAFMDQAAENTMRVFGIG
ncbi:MAG: TatD family hydrolase [Deltaproteobacteria bacterium]|nr:TatD family hydrolase [Candidatus Zymogenaceae bacterium]